MFLLLSTGTFVADTVRVTLPVTQPQRISAGSSSFPSWKSLPTECDASTLIELIATVEDLKEFLTARATHRNAEGVSDFLCTYRESPEDFRQDGWTGPCNTFAEFTAHWAYVHGGIPYTVSLCPKGVTSKLTKGWHQITVCRVGHHQLLIFDNEDAIEWEGTLEEYVTAERADMTIFSIGGVIPWRKTQDTIRAKFLDHLRRNMTELEESPLPRSREKQLATPPMPLV